MRSLIAIAITVAALCSAPVTADAGGKVDRQSAAYQALPEGGRALVGKLAAAGDGKQVKAFVALLPDPLELGGTTYDHAALARAIAGHGGIARAFELGKGAWTVAADDDGQLTVHRGASSTGFVIAEVGGAWIVQGVVADTAGSGALSLLHPEQVVAFTAHRDACQAGRQAPMVMSAPQVSAGMEAALVNRYLKRHRPKFEYCYEKQLLADPSLTGTVTTRFVIDADGQVGDVASSGISPEVSACVAQAVDGIETARPREAPVKVAFTLQAVPYDDKIFECDGAPVAVNALAERLARAIDAGDVKAFAALLPGKLSVRGRTLSRAKVKAAVAADENGLAGWLGMFNGAWTLEPGAGKNTFHLMKFYAAIGRGGGSRVNDPVEIITVIELAKAGSKWKVRSIQRGCRGIC